MSSNGTAVLLVYGCDGYICTQHDGIMCHVERTVLRVGTFGHCITDDGVHVYATDLCIWRNDTIVYKNIYHIVQESLAVCNQTGKIVFRWVTDPTAVCVIQPDSQGVYTVGPIDLTLDETMKHVRWSFSNTGRLFYIIYEKSGEEYVHWVYHVTASACHDDTQSWNKIMAIHCSAYSGIGVISENDEMLYISTKLGIQCHPIWHGSESPYLIRYPITQPGKYEISNIQVLPIGVAFTTKDKQYLFQATFPHATTLLCLMIGCNRLKIWMPSELFEVIAREYLELGPHLSSMF